jgi:CRP-like cAMP-binding protein
MSQFFQSLEHHHTYFKKYGQLVTYRKNEYLANSHDPNNWVFFLVSGLVCVGFSTESGEDKLIGYFLPGMTFAQSGSFFDEFSTVQLDYKACDESSVLRVDRKQFLASIKGDNNLSEDYVNALLRNQIFLIERIVYQSEKGVYNKCVRWLLFMAKFYGQKTSSGIKIITPITQETAANFMNVTRESAASALITLKNKSLISTRRKHLTIHSLASLEKEIR